MQCQPETWQAQPGHERRHVVCCPSLCPGDAAGGPGEREGEQGSGSKSGKKNLVLKIWSENSVFVNRKKEKKKKNKHKKHVCPPGEQTVTSSFLTSRKLRQGLGNRNSRQSWESKIELFTSPSTLFSQ